MILALDMGNTNIKVGMIEKGAEGLSVKEERLMTDSGKTSMEYALMMMSIFDFYGLKKESFKGAIISSVVPLLTGTLATAVRKVLDKEPLIVDGSMKMDISLKKMPIPKLLGSDLIIGAEAAYKLYEPPVIVINMGTATAITLVGADSCFEGGIILPGVKTSIGALVQNAAQLPEIDLNRPGSVVTIDTMEAMRSGIIYGNAAQLDGLLERMEEEYGSRCTLVATGGLARFIIPYCKREIVLDDELLMKGLYYLYEENRPES